MKALIEAAWEERGELAPDRAPTDLRQAVEACLDELEAGRLRVAEPLGEPGEWSVRQWLKKAVLLSFRLHDNEVIEAGFTRFYDKLPLRWAGGSKDRIDSAGARIVPPATVRRGAHIGRDAVLMPSYVNIGAHVGPGTMVDTWATVGSCAQIGANVHLSGGVGIGGVLEPLQANGAVSSRWSYILARAPRSTTGRPVRYGGGGFPPDRSSCPARFLPATAATRCTVPSSSSRWTRKPAPALA
jgi:2,3,4,5-tetrahydropyridine-2-carboxylate N-succinyltransferase